MTDGLGDEYNPMSPLVEAFPADAKLAISPAMGISAMALGLAIKYHDINTIQEGTLYQAIKMEGKEVLPLNLQMVLETAKLFEAHIMQAPNRLTDMVMDAVEEGINAIVAGEGNGADQDEEPIVCKIIIDGQEHLIDGWTITGIRVYELANLPAGGCLMLKSDTDDMEVENNHEFVIDLDIDMVREFYSSKEVQP